MAESDLWMQTHTGHRVDILHPKPETIRAWDIATHLAALPRFGGAVGANRHYSVAEHSVFVMRIVDCFMGPVTTRVLHAALLHDASEYVLGDIIWPVKQAIREVFEPIETRVQATIERVFGCDGLTKEEGETIKSADRMALIFERDRLLPAQVERWAMEDSVMPPRWRDQFLDEGWPNCWSPTKAREAFLEMHENLIRRST